MKQQMQTKQTGKKSRWWLWLIIILVVIAVGIGIYFWLFSGGSEEGVLSNILHGRIPQPPALPD